MKKLLMILFIVALVMPVSCCLAEQLPQENGLRIPDWLRRIDYGINIETDQKPRVYMETVQPLYQSVDKKSTFFTHDRISLQDERGTYSLGYGYRQLVRNENLLLGVNQFFDFQDLHKHYRTGVGIEALARLVEFRSNAYFGLSPKRAIEEGGGAKTYEKAVNGGDVEIGCPIPYLPWIKVFGSYYQYDFRKFKDMRGWQMRTELRPLKAMTINFVTYDDNKGGREYRLDGRFSLAFDTFAPRSIISALGPAKEPFPGNDLKEMTLARVERNFNIQTEKWTESSGVTIEIGRK